MDVPRGHVAVPAGRTVAFLDLGTNSVRLVVVRLHANQAVTTLTQQKEMVRLGEGEFGDGYLQPEAIQRAVLVCRKLADLAGAYGAEEIVAVATSATREARNQAELVARLQREAGLDLRVISGLEEARLTFLGITSGLHLDGRRVLCIDIGGGSTELIVGDATDYEALASVKVGAVRLTNLFFLPDEEEPVSSARYALIRRYVQSAGVRAVQQVREHPFDLAFGSSGTIENLADVACQALHGRRRERDEPLMREDLAQVVELLCSRPQSERRQVPGINPARADIIVGGAAILDSFMTELGVAEIRISDRGLREGLIVDYLARSGHGDLLRGMSVRERSVLQLGRACGFDEAHARSVARLAAQLFDAAREAGLHRYGEAERELLEHAAILHDIGGFLSYSDHHRHTYYLVRNAELLGFNQTEIVLMATVARFHRKGFPGKRRPELAGLGKRQRRTVRRLAALLRLAENLDRSHAALVTAVAFLPDKDGGMALRLATRGEAELELWGAQGQTTAFARAFGRKLTVIAAPDLQLALPDGE